MFGKKLRLKCLYLAATQAKPNESIISLANVYYKFCSRNEVAMDPNKSIEETDGSISGKIDATPSNTDTQNEPTPPLSSEPSPSDIAVGTVDPSQVNS
jgi:hypothetical protein